jgi:hypothetical protein
MHTGEHPTAQAIAVDPHVLGITLQIPGQALDFKEGELTKIYNIAPY